MHFYVIYFDCDNKITMYADFHLAFCCMINIDVNFVECYFYKTSTANQHIEI